MCIGKKREKNWKGCFGPIVGNAELDFLLLLMGILEEYQSELYFFKKSLIMKSFKHLDVEKIVQ